QGDHHPHEGGHAGDAPHALHGHRFRHLGDCRDEVRTNDMGMLTKIRPSAGGTTSEAETTEVPQENLETIEQAAPVKTPAKRTPPWEKLLKKRREAKEENTLDGTFDAYPHLKSIKPRERYTFRSDYFDVDGSVACIL